MEKSLNCAFEFLWEPCLSKYLMNQWVDWNPIYMDITLGGGEDLIRFW